MIEVLQKTKTTLEINIKCTSSAIDNIRMALAKGNAGPSTIMVIKILEQDLQKYRKLSSELDKVIKVEKEKQNKLGYKISKFLRLI